MNYRLIIVIVVVVISSIHPFWDSETFADDSAELLSYKIKTAFLFNFAKFVDWPSDQANGFSEEFTIGIIAPPKLITTAQLLQNKSVKGSRVKLLVFESLEELTPCHILFVGYNQDELLRTVIARFKTLPVLTVADVPGFAGRGGVINFITVDNTIRFEINPEVAEEKHLKISSKLLNLARIVTSTGLEGAEK